MSSEWQMNKVADMALNQHMSQFIDKNFHI